MRSLGIGVLLLLGGADDIHADMFEAGGLTFSDELGGFRLISATGSGSTSDPIVLVEEISGMGPAVLTIRQSDAGDVKTPVMSVLLRSLVKVVVNKSGWHWSGFDLELRDYSGQASVFGDGLSFDQIRIVAKPLHSDLFAAARAEDEPFDRLRFDQGRVKPGEKVQLAFNLADINPKPIFYLAQQPIVLMAGALRE